MSEYSVIDNSQKHSMTSCHRFPEQISKVLTLSRFYFLSNVPLIGDAMACSCMILPAMLPFLSRQLVSWFPSETLPLVSLYPSSSVSLEILLGYRFFSHYSFSCLFIFLDLFPKIVWTLAYNYPIPHSFCWLSSSSSMWPFSLLYRFTIPGVIIRPFGKRFLYDCIYSPYCFLILHFNSSKHNLL